MSATSNLAVKSNLAVVKKSSALANLNRLTTIWAIIEARQKTPALIAVASATDTDDTESVARGLAQVAQEIGERTGYLYLGSARRPSDDSHSYAELTVAGRDSVRENFDESLAIWRATYDVIIVELPQLPACPLGAHVARLADGVVIALFTGRKVLTADRDLKALLSQLNASIFGIVKSAAHPAPARKSVASKRSFTSLFFPLRQP